MSVPFHKQLDPNKQAGQIVNPTPENLTLAGYIKTVKRAQAFDDVANEKKLTFDEWYKSLKAKPGQMPYDDWFVCMQEAWRFALKQGKL